MLPETFRFAGIPFAGVNRTLAAEKIARLALSETSSYVCVTGAHGVVEASRNPHFKETLQGASMVTPDGTPLSWYARLRGLRHVTRVTGWEMIHDTAICKSKALLRHYFFGASPEILEGIAKNLRQINPDIAIGGMSSPPYRPLTEGEIHDLVGELQSADVNVLWLGISTPRQELLARDLAQRLPTGVVIACGAGFDFIAGAKGIAPRWVTRIGLEWLFRLLQEPRRLARRYASVIPRFAVLFILELVFRSDAPSATNGRTLKPVPMTRTNMEE